MPKSQNEARLYGDLAPVGELIMGVRHTSDCVAKTAQREAVRRAWHVAWPDACGYCCGRGGTYHHGSFFEPPSFDPCPGCTEDGNCARCGGLLTNPDEGEGPCTVCGWNYDDSAPEPHECDCLMHNPA